MLKKILIILIFLLSALNSADAAPKPTIKTYYIATNGSDITGVGTTRKPWKTLSYACTQVTAQGSIIKFKGGNYIETIPSIVAPRVNIDAGGATITSNVLNSPTIILMSSEGTNGSQYIANLIMNGDALKAHSAILVSGRSNVSIHHSVFRDFRVSGVIFNGGTDTTDTKSRIMFGRDTIPLAPTKYATGNQFLRNEIDNCAIFYPSNRAKGALMIGGQDGMQILDNTIIQDSREVGTNGYPIKYYRGGHNNNIIVARNILIRSPQILLRDEFFLGCAIELWHSNNITISENRLVGGISLTYLNGAQIHHNTISFDALDEYPKTGIHISGDANNITINNNYFKNLALQIDIIAFSKTTLDNIKIHTNIMYNIGVSTNEWWGEGIRIGGLTADTVTNINIISNTIIANPEDRNTRIGLYLPTTGYATDINIQNNIITGFRYASIFAAGPQAIINKISIENNLLWDNIQTGKSYAINDNPYFTNIKDPLNLSYKNNIIFSPLFVSEIDFHLQDSSPAVSAGIYVPWITLDYDDISVGNPPNIGAYSSISLKSRLLEDEYHLIVYPVPTTNYLTVSVNDPSFEPNRITIYDINGKTVYSQRIYENYIHIYPLNLFPGVYIVKVEGSLNKILAEKIIVGVK
jgi:hypothetical protein